MNSENSPKNSESASDMNDVAEHMTDVEVALQLITGIWPLHNGNRQSVIKNAFDGLKAVERTLPKRVLRRRKRQWTERRVRSIVDVEDIRVEHYEIKDIQKMAMREARNEYEKSMATASHMAAFLKRYDPRSNRTQSDQLGQFFREMDGPGVVQTPATDALRNGSRRNSFLQD